MKRRHAKLELVSLLAYPDFSVRMSVAQSDEMPARAFALNEFELRILSRPTTSSLQRRVEWLPEAEF